MRKVLTLFILLVSASTHADPVMEYIEAFCNSGDKTVSMTAMLYATPFKDVDAMTECTRKNISKDDTIWEKTLKYYAIARFTNSPESYLDFINSMPEDADNLQALLDFEGGIFQQPSGEILPFLMNLAKYGTADVQRVAKIKLKKIYPVLDGWAADLISEYR